MFDLLDRPLHWITVKWPALKQGEDGGLSVPIEHEVELRVELVDRDEAKALFPGMFGEETVDQPDELATIKRVVKAWRKIVANGSPVPFDDEHIQLLLKVPVFASAFANAYVQALAGRVEVREGNSGGSPSDGRADEPKVASTTKLPETANGSE